MSEIPSSFYYFSTESYGNGLPCRAKYIKNLRSTSNPDREVILIECGERVAGYRSKYLVLVPKLQGTSFTSLDEVDPVFAHVLDGTDFVDAQDIDLSQGSKLIADIGGITKDIDAARKWQVGRVEDAESVASVRGLRAKGTPR